MFCEYEYKGKTYEVSLFTQKKKDQFERKLVERAVQGAREIAALDPDCNYSDLLSSINESKAKGDFAFEGRLGLEAVKTAPGTMLLGSILFGCDLQEMGGILLSDPKKVADIIKGVLQESYPRQAPEESNKKKADTTLLTDSSSMPV